jgi:4-aminobutyrate aminotransferase-like enzyme
MGLTSHHTWKLPTLQGPYVHHALCPEPYRSRFGGTPEDIAAASADDIGELIRYSTPGRIAAFIAEPIQGVGGVTSAAPNYFREAYRIAREHGGLCIADEVQTGFGRTGRMFAIEHTGVRPDILVMAKGIASGFPFSAIGASAELMQRWPTGSHGGTYGGNPIGCAAALATLEVLTEPGFLDQVVERGAQLIDGLRLLQDRHECIVDVRGLGLMVGCDLDDPARTAAMLGHCVREEKLLLMNAGAAGTTIRWMPPLTVSSEEVELALAAFGRALDATA